ncbi:MAG TPA: serine acetyltransferase [Candidatus Competibacteraceae bacterium]|nr:serine acetyltransferase [Candidatus Competibacteraceae bacterium]
MSAWADLREDFRRVSKPHRPPLKRLFYALSNYGFLAIAVYRFGRAVNAVRVPVLGTLLRIVYFLAKTLIEVLFGISIDVNSRIGPGFYIGHFGGIVIHGDLGRHCSVGQGVTIGSRGAGRSDGWPTLGDNVFVGAGAKIIGRIRVGNDVVIGANAVVVKDVPDGMLAVGVPARLRPRGGAGAAQGTAQ